MTRRIECWLAFFTAQIAFNFLNFFQLSGQTWLSSFILFILGVIVIGNLADVIVVYFLKVNLIWHNLILISSNCSHTRLRLKLTRSSLWITFRACTSSSLTRFNIIILRNFTSNMLRLVITRLSNLNFNNVSLIFWGHLLTFVSW